MRRFALRGIAVFYLLAVLLGPLAMVFYRAFQQGVQPLWESLTDPNTMHAFELTLEITAIAVPVNTVFGVVCALTIVRQRFPGAGIVNAIVDLPLALSPVVVGLMLFLLYGRAGWFGSWFADHGMQILFATPAMVIATIFVSLPFVAREVVPTLREIGDEQEQERNREHDDRHRRRAVLVPALDVVEDEDRGNLRLEREVAADQDDRADLADRACEREGDAGEDPGEDVRQHDAAEDTCFARAERPCRLLRLAVELVQHRLHRPHNERQADEDQRHDNTRGRVGDLPTQVQRPVRADEPADPAVL